MPIAPWSSVQHILLVDDDIAALQGMAKLLRHDGFDIIAVALPEVALEMLDAERFDAVVTDLEMPIVDGVALLAKARDTQPHARLFVVSGSQRAQNLGLEGVVILAKPLDYEDLLGHLSPKPSRATSFDPDR